MNSFFDKYYESINIGLLSTEFSIKQKQVDANLFFSTIQQKIKKIRDKKFKLFFLGNGASSAFANHMALDFSKNGKIMAKSLSDSSLLTALANDYSYEDALIQFINLEKVCSDDLVVTISSSGNSPNIVNLLEYCKLKNIPTLSLSGLKFDNKSRSLSEFSLFVPMKTYGIVECIHQIFLHLILDESMNIQEWVRIDTQNMKHSEFNL